MEREILAWRSRRAKCMQFVMSVAWIVRPERIEWKLYNKDCVRVLETVDCLGNRSEG